MTYEIYNYIFIGAAALSGILLVLSVVLFFLLDIPKVIGDLSGSNAKKGIENIRKQNEASGDKSYKSSSVNLRRGRVTDKISNSGRVEKPASGAFAVGAGTAKISGANPMQPPKAPAAAPAEGTMVLDNNATMVLENENATMVLGDAPAASEMQTTLLSAPVAPAASETTMLSGQLQPQMYAMPIQPQAVFEVEIEITYIHTNVTIPQEG